MMVSLQIAVDTSTEANQGNRSRAMMEMQQRQNCRGIEWDLYICHTLKIQIQRKAKFTGRLKTPWLSAELGTPSKEVLLLL